MFQATQGLSPIFLAPELSKNLSETGERQPKCDGLETPCKTEKSRADRMVSVTNLAISHHNCLQHEKIAACLEQAEQAAVAGEEVQLNP